MHWVLGEDALVDGGESFTPMHSHALNLTCHWLDLMDMPDTLLPPALHTGYYSADEDAAQNQCSSNSYEDAIPQLKAVIVL